MSIRPVKRIVQSQPTIEGAGVQAAPRLRLRQHRRIRPVSAARRFPQRPPRGLPAPGFPWHPHRGIETITYVLAGTVDHGDSLGNRGTLGAGDVQWMTAGSGILHQEMPKGDPQGRMHGFQLWANLPSSLKMTRAALSGRSARRHSRGRSTTTARACGSSAATSGASSGPVRRGRRRSALPRRLGPAGPAQDAAGRDRRATPSPTSSRDRARSATPRNRSAC